MRMRRNHLLLLLAATMALAGCAKMGQPDGGWFDETPPHVIATMPADQSTNINTSRVTIIFDEYIKLDNPTEKVVISPPQLEAPDIKSGGNRIIVNLKDTLIPNTTYTIDFSDAISDNNEGNPLGNYTYSFSTGDRIDTLEVAGYVVEAENMEPIKGILVGLYSNLEDSAFTTQPMQRFARTDSRGRFVIKGVAPSEYRIYALQDADANFMFSQKSEKLAFNHDIIIPSSMPDVRQDTIWSDTLHIKSIDRVGYTHFLPDNIVLRAFTEEQTDRFLSKSDRTNPERITFYFSYGDSILPKIRGLNFNSDDAFILESSERRDTLTYWLRDSLLINQDTLRMEMTYMMTDTLGMLNENTDTLELVPKVSYERRMKELQKEREKWEKEQEKNKKKGKNYETEMPVEPLAIKTQLVGDMMPDSYFYFESPTPILTADTSRIHLTTKVDSIVINKPYILAERTIMADSIMPAARRFFVLRPDSTGNLWTQGTSFNLELDSAAFTDIYGNVSKAEKKAINVKKEDEFTTIVFHVNRSEEVPYVGQLLDKSERVVRQAISNTGDLTFNYVKTGEYYLRTFADRNGNGVWDTGKFATDLQAETMWYYPEKLECKAKWPLEKTWTPTTTTDRLKPSEITKQKPEKEKKIKNQNMERAQRLGIIYIPKNH